VLRAQVPSVRALAGALGVPLARTRDPQALGTLTLTSGWTFADGALAFESLQAHLDDTTLSGRVAYRRAAGAPLLELDLRGDHVNLDRYVSAEAKPSGAAGFSIEELRALPIAGTLVLDQARLSGSELNQVRLEMGSSANVGLGNTDVARRSGRAQRWAP
jgi:hypothetical protein